MDVSRDFEVRKQVVVTTIKKERKDKNESKKSLKEISLGSRSGGTPLKSNKDYYRCKDMV